MIRHATASGLAALGALHVAWGGGASFPFSTREELADTVVGAEEFPSATASYAVGGLLLGAAAVVMDAPILPVYARRVGVAGVVAALGTRACLGFAGRTDILSPASNSARFRQMDKAVYSPLCAVLALGAARSAAVNSRSE